MFSLEIDQEISLRTFHPDDADPLFELMESNRARLRPWIDPSLLFETAKATRIFTIECFFDGLEDSPETLDLFHHYVSELDGYFLSPRRSLEMGIWFQGSLVGFITLSRLEDSFTAAEIGYWITAEQEGKGIITRCVSALMDYAIDKMKVLRFVIGCAVNNQRSRAVPERLGYRLHAIVPKGEKLVTWPTIGRSMGFDPAHGVSVTPDRYQHVEIKFAHSARYACRSARFWFGHSPVGTVYPWLQPPASGHQ